MSRRFRDETAGAATRPLDTTPRSLRRAAVVFAAAFTMLLPSTALGAAKGIQTEITWNGVDSSTQQSDANAMSDLGVTWTRMTLSWHDVETSKGSYDSKKLAQIDNAVDLARARGINIVMDVYESPQWASGSSDKNAPPQNPQDYADFVRAMASRYVGRIAGWEIWNEENLGHFWGGSPNPAAYAQLLRAAYPAVKAGDSSTQVVFGGISTNDWAFVQAVYDAAPDIGRYYDVMATHPYTPQAPPDQVNWDDSSHIDRMSFAGYRTVHQVMLDHGDSKPFWFTEMGWSTTSQPGWGVSAQQQADYTRMAWACMNQDPYVQVGILYELRNNFWAGNADDWDDQLGISYVDWSHKPAYDAFKSTDPNAGGCTYGTPPPAQPAPAAAPSTQSTQTTQQSSSEPAPKPTLQLRVKTQGVHSAGATKDLKTGVKFTVFGRVVYARGGSVLLTFEHRLHGTWHRADQLRLRVKRDGVFTSRQLKALSKGGWRVRGAYSTRAKSHFVYFKA